ncbi:MAG: coenzyme F420-0:L-glutamate ligase [Rhodospirillaceae bacterium]|nr:coenzyme F420-0:L-glutamate ligase [Rhodospirillaceae bacterium]
MSTRRLTLSTIDGIPLVKPGDDVTSLLLDGLLSSGDSLEDGDILVIAQKIFSKAQNRYVSISDVTPSPEAERLAVEVDKDPRIVELILSESNEVVRHRPGVLIVAHRLGYVMANAGIDASNVAEGGEEDERVLLLPVDPDGDCAQVRDEIKARAGVDVAVIMNDSVGRAWRSGTAGIAIGVAGMPAILDLRGDDDLFGRPLKVSIVGIADELAAAASILQGQAAEGAPAVVIRGYSVAGEHSTGQALIRDKGEDLFR